MGFNLEDSKDAGWRELWAKPMSSAGNFTLKRFESTTNDIFLLISLFAHFNELFETRDAKKGDLLRAHPGSQLFKLHDLMSLASCRSRLMR